MRKVINKFLGINENSSKEETLDNGDRVSSWGNSTNRTFILNGTNVAILNIEDNTISFVNNCPEHIKDEIEAVVASIGRQKEYTQEEANKLFEKGALILNAGNGKPPMKNYDSVKIELYEDNIGGARFFFRGEEVYSDTVLIEDATKDMGEYIAETIEAFEDMAVGIKEVGTLNEDGDTVTFDFNGRLLFDYSIADDEVTRGMDGRGSPLSPDGIFKKVKIIQKGH